ncbi:MAG: hypothetical protein J3K34DRAFT_404557 [Monoraphidium minutum]|nr:MAG: hypothetical protein J3K34DRAFT_404557 [Monoraphidium minutum]
MWAPMRQCVRVLCPRSAFFMVSAFSRAGQHTPLQQRFACRHLPPPTLQPRPRRAGRVSRAGAAFPHQAAALPLSIRPRARRGGSADARSLAACPQPGNF